MKVKTNNHFDLTKRFLLNSSGRIYNEESIRRIAKSTVEKLESSSPEVLKNNWSYELVKEDNNRIVLYFNNSSSEDRNYNLAILLDTGHATKEGGWVSGKHFTKEPIDEAYEKIINSAKEELNKL